MEFERNLSLILFTVLDVVSLSQVYFAIFPMDKNIEQRICLKFCIAKGISCAESLKMLQEAYGESTLSKTRTYEWCSGSKSGLDVLKYFPGCGKNHHLSLREIAAESSMSHESICTILNNFLHGKNSIAVRSIPVYSVSTHAL